jgi:hypothetical protein
MSEEKISVFSVGGKPSPDEYVKHGKYKERRVKIVAKDRHRIVIKTDGPLTEGWIVLTGSTIMCQGAAKPVWGPFVLRYEAQLGKDLINKEGNLWEWRQPPDYLIKHQAVGDDLTFFEFS